MVQKNSYEFIFTLILTMAASIDNLKYFLKEMFQFNENDLDFGIYKIYNLKRKHIEAFIDGNGENDLTPTIEKILKEVNLENQKTDAIELSNFLKGINKDSLLENPEKNYEKIKGQLELDIEDETQKAKLVETLNNLSKSEGLTEELKDKIYNHILGFFQMYYSNGDFGYNDRSRDLYKVPYEADYDGTDTMYHWKHKGSLYIKTGLSFNAIKFDLNGKKIEYRLETNIESENEGTSRNNNKDNQLKHYRFDRIEKVDGVFKVIFNLSDSSTSKVDIFKAIYKDIFKKKEVEKYLVYEKDGKVKTVFVDLTKDFDKVQNGQIKGLSALRQAKTKVEKEVKNNFERGVRLFNEETKEFTDETLKSLYKLDQKLNSFYIGNDADYFIHENLNEFLTNEKQRFVKNYIFDDLESIFNGKLDNTTLLIAKAFDKVISRIIEFLSSIEDFQKYLFTKKKKVVESEYCITIDYINETYYEEILSNNLQLAEWLKIISIDIKTIKDLKANPTLVIDTKFFKQTNGANPFKDKVLSEIDDLDIKTNGLLINSENYQGLKVLQNKYKSKVKTIYTDPPYNAKSSEIIYKNNFKHSSWASFMQNRISLSKTFLQEDGIFEIAIDDYEVTSLWKICESVFGSENFIANILVIHNPRGRNDDKFFGTSHEYMLTFALNREKAQILNFKPSEEHIKQFNKEDEISIYALTGYMRTGNNSNRFERPNLYYPIYIDPKSKKLSLTNSPGLIEKLPINSDGDEKTWRWGKDTFLEKKDTDIFVSEKDGVWNLQKKRRFIGEGKKPKTIWHDSRYDASTNGIMLMKALFNDVSLFSYPKSIYTVLDALSVSTSKYSTILDYFAGSATTGHAAIKLNKQDDGFRKYLLLEMGIYFNNVTKPRIQKVVYSDNWKNGKPLDNNGSQNHIFKYQVLEQYEDVLDNLHTYNGVLPNNIPIKYLYRPEENSIDSTLNLFNPFNNIINYGQPTQQGFIDLVETYIYLEGYFIKSIKTFNLNKKFYKVVETTNGVLLVWRVITINEDDSKQVIEITSKYENIHTIEINAEFATLNLDKNNYLKVGTKDIELKIIHKEVFNQ